MSPMCGNLSFHFSGVRVDKVDKYAVLAQLLDNNSISVRYQHRDLFVCLFLRG